MTVCKSLQFHLANLEITLAGLSMNPLYLMALVFNTYPTHQYSSWPYRIAPLCTISTSPEWQEVNLQCHCLKDFTVPSQL